MKWRALMLLVFTFTAFQVVLADHVDYGLEQAPFENFARVPADQLRIAFLGTLVPHKGAHLLLEAWAALADFGNVHHVEYQADQPRRTNTPGTR